MHVNGESQMKLFGTKSLLEKLLDSFEQDKDSTLGKTILIVIFDSMGYLLLFVLFLIIIPMLLPVIILPLLQKPLLFVLTVLENLKLLPYGKEKELDLKKSIHKDTPTLSDFGIRLSHKE